MYLMEALLCGSRSSVASERIDNVQAAPNNPAVNIMQTIHKACLALTGVVVVILCVGIGMGIGRRLESKSSYDNSTDYDNSTEYEAYDEDYVDNGASPVFRTGEVIKLPNRQQVCTRLCNRKGAK